MIMDKLKNILVNVFGIDTEQINDETSPSNVPSWDSFNGLMLVSELESGFNIKFTMDEINTVKTFGDIKLALKKHGVILEE